MTLPRSDGPHDDRSHTDPAADESSPHGGEPPLDSIVACPEAIDPSVSGLLGVSFQAFVGPLPPPAVLEAYDRLSPGEAKKMFDNARAQSKHRRELEERIIRGDDRRADRGLQYGAGLSALTMTYGFIAILMGHQAAGATLATGSVVALAAVFVYGSIARRQERLNKKMIAELIRSGRAVGRSPDDPSGPKLP